jgi:hypothetical protein
MAKRFSALLLAIASILLPVKRRSNRGGRGGSQRKSSSAFLCDLRGNPHSRGMKLFVASDSTGVGPVRKTALVVALPYRPEEVIVSISIVE